MTLKNLKKTKNYYLGNLMLCHLKYPEYGEAGWFVDFNFIMSYKNIFIPFESLDPRLKYFILENIV